MEEQKPELDDFNQRNFDEYTDRLWQQRVKTERESAESDDDTGSYSPTRENYYYDTYYPGDADAFREPFDYPLKRSAEEPLSPSSGSSVAVPAKRTRGRPYKEACVKITCLRPEDRLSTTLTVDFNKLSEEELGVPKSELVGGLRSSSKLPLTWSAEDLRSHILKLFPRVRSFVYMRCTQGKTLESLPDDLKPTDLRNVLGRSGLYVVPFGPLMPKGSSVSSPSSGEIAACSETSYTAASTSQTGCSSSSNSSSSNNSSGSSGNNTVDTTTTVIAAEPKQYWVPVKVHGEKVINNDEEFRITLDITNYSPDEISLKTKKNKIVIHCKHEERADEYGLIERELKRQYILPQDVDPNEVTSSLSTSGILTLKAPKIHKDDEKERIIPIQFSFEDS